MPRYKLIISYDGTDYSGWQVQANGKAIQPLIQKALETALRHPIDLTGSGRTDAGVHALGQTAHFDTSSEIAPHRLLLSLNALLPKDIRIRSVDPVPAEFHARYAATSKVYHYHLQVDRIADPFSRLYRHHIPPSDLDRLKRAIPHFLGERDFKSFANESSRGSASRDSIRTLQRLDFIEQPGGARLEFEADGFLYKMVRNITGTLLDIAAGRIELSDLPAIFESKDRRSAGSSAPPHGLFLIEVKYPQTAQSVSGRLLA